MNEEQMQKISEIRERVNKPDLVINKVPKTELDWFKNWAKEEFENNYGFALKSLIAMKQENDFLKNQLCLVYELKKNDKNL